LQTVEKKKTKGLASTIKQGVYFFSTPVSIGDAMFIM